MAKKGSGKPIPVVEVNLELSGKQAELLLVTLQTRFEENLGRHDDIEWSEVRSRLEAQPQKLSSLSAMEHTEGEPDVVDYDQQADQFIFMDCSPQSPMRRHICYDREGEEMREKKGVFPGGNAVDLAEAMGIELLDEDQYRFLQTLGEFDTKTESWVKTPSKIRNLGGGLFMDRRYDTVFVFHNGAQSFYGSRGFRGVLRV